MSDPLIGQVISDRYRLDALLGEGGMGRVYRGEHVLMRKRVAIKVLHSELLTIPEVIARFEREAMASAHIEHPHVATATDFGKLPDGSVFLVLEYVEGKSLTALGANGPVPFPRVLRIAMQVLSALEAAHSRGIVHRDLKPDNILLVAREDGEDFVKVLDFGIAKVPAEHTNDGKAITQVGMVYGTPEYMAPEQALGQDVDATADIYALGVVLYELLTGSRPYTGPVVGLLGQQLTKPLPLLAERNPAVKVPPRVEALIRDMLVTDRAGRVPSATVARGRIEALLQDHESGKLGRERESRMLSLTFDEVTSTLTRSLSKPMQKAVSSRGSRTLILSVVFGAVGLGVAMAAMGMFGGAKGEAEAGVPAVVEAETPSAGTSVASPEERQKEIEAAKKEGAPALVKLAAKYPGEAVIHAELASAYAKAKKYIEAVDTVRVALALDPKLNENRAVKGALFRAAQAQESSVAAFRILRGPMGSAGADIVYDLAQTEKISSWVKKQSHDFLHSKELTSIASPALLLALDLARVESCEEALLLLKTAVQIGDDRSLPSLRRFAVGTDCGQFHSKDCFACMRDKPDLQAAMNAIKERQALKEQAEAKNLGAAP